MNKIKFTKKLLAIMAASMLAVTSVGAGIVATTSMTAQAAEAPLGSIMLDTAQYILAPGNQYTIGAFIKDPNGNQLTVAQVKGLVDAGKLKVSDSRNGSIIDLKQLSTGHFQITAKNAGTCYVVYDIGGTHASVRIDVEKGVKQHGTAVRNTSIFTQKVFNYGPDTYTPSQININVQTQTTTPITTTQVTTTTTKPTTSSSVKLVDVMEPYDTNDDFDKNDSGKGTFTMATEQYTDGYAIKTFGAKALFNLNKEYETLEFDLGHIDNTGSNEVCLTFIGDGIVIDTIDFYSDEMPKHFVIDVKDIKNLQITTSTKSISSNSTKYGLANVMLNAKASMTLKTNNSTILNRHTHDGIYLYNGINAFDTKYFKVANTFISNGERYVNAIIFDMSQGKAVYNLKGEYKTLEFDLGLFPYYTNTPYTRDISLLFVKDGQESDVIEMSADSLVEHYSIDVRGVKQLIIQRNERDSANGTSTGLANAILYR